VYRRQPIPGRFFPPRTPLLGNAKPLINPRIAGFRYIADENANLAIVDFAPIKVM
jgi:hypothetical protein